MFSEELCNTQNALFLRTHREKKRGSTDCVNICIQRHLLTPHRYLVGIHFVLVGDPVQKLFAHLD